MNNNIQRILITRPEQAGLKLASRLNSAGYKTLCQPMFDYQSFGSKAALVQHLKQQQPETIIFISVAAVDYAQALLPINQWQQFYPTANFIAVGSATQAALEKLGINALCPSQHTSEGILSLPCFQAKDLTGHSVVIIRGDSGREHLAQSLTTKHAKVTYFATYQRNWFNFTTDQDPIWRKQQINCIVVTSNALLKSIVNLIDISDTYWRETCLWLVPSERVAQQAHQFGLSSVINTESASDQAILASLLHME